MFIVVGCLSGSWRRILQGEGAMFIVVGCLSGSWRRLLKETERSDIGNYQESKL